MKYYSLLFVTIIALFFNSCDVVNPAEKVPTYVHIDSFTFKINDPSKEGSGSQKINCAWVYFNNDAIGVFDLPANIPVATDVAGVISVIPGVNKNGLRDYNTQYPFFVTDSLTITPNGGNITVFNAKTSYSKDAIFQWKEDFETGNTFIPFNDALTDDTTIVRVNTNDMVFEGAGAGYIYMDATHKYSENICNTGFPIPQGKAFLEINYKCNTSFQLGLQTVISGAIDYEYFAGVKAKEGWNKLYIDISEYTAAKNGSVYRVIIKAGLDDGLSTGYVLLDNLKVITY